MTTGFSIGGIASGLDTATMIRQLMDLERQPIVRFQQRQAELRQVDGAWSEIVTKVSAFRTALDAVRDASDWSSFLVASSSDEAAVTATATGGGAPGSVSFTVTSLASRHRLQTSGSFAAPTDLVGTGTFDLTSADGTTTLASIATDATTTLADLAQLIDDAGVGVDAQVLKVADGDHRLVLTATETGQAAAFDVATDLTALGATSVLQSGTDAQLDLGGGLTVSRSSNTITDLIDGVTLQLHATTTTAVDVTATRGTEAAADAVEALVKAADDVLGTLAKRTSYNAESGRGGVLQGDAAARSLELRIRSLLSDSAGAGTVTHGSQMGISLTRAGRVEVDRSALEQALQDDFEGVSSFVVDGLGAALDGYLETVEGSGGSIQRSRDAIDGRIRSYDDRIEAFESRLELRERTLRRQFTGLETALAQLQAQGQWLAGQLGSFSQPPA